MKVLASVLLALVVAVVPLTAVAAEKEPPKKQESEQAASDAKRRAALRLQRNQRILSQKELEVAMAPHVPAIQACYVKHTAKRETRGVSSNLKC